MPFKKYVFRDVGNPRFFRDPQELYDLWMDYIDDCEREDQLPTLAGFRSNKCIPYNVLNSYSHKEEYADVMSLINDMIEHMTVNSKGVDGQTKKLILSTKFGYVDRTVAENKNLELNLVELIKSQMTPSMIEAKALELSEGKEKEEN